MTFHVQFDQLTGPAWVKSEEGPERFDINANVPPGATREQVDKMMENLLKERFHLEYHREKREFDTYELVVAKGGSKLKDAEVPAQTPQVPSGPLRATRGDDGFPVLPACWPMAVGVGGSAQMFISLPALEAAARGPAPGGRRPFGLGPAKFTLRMVTVGQLIAVAQGYMDSSHVVDHTGLTGKYDVKVAFATGPPPPGVAPTEEATEPAPDVVAAFEKHLGLKFEKAKVPLDVIVVDRIEKTPDDN